MTIQSGDMFISTCFGFYKQHILYFFENKKELLKKKKKKLPSRDAALPSPPKDAFFPGRTERVIPKSVL